YQVREMTYRETAERAREFAARLAQAGIGADDKVMIWSENRAEWLVAFWGCLLARVVVVPVDYRPSEDLLPRIAAGVQAKAVLIGSDVPPPTGSDAPVWKLRDISSDFHTERSTRNPVISAGDGRRPDGSTLAEIIFTSGATAEPKGVTITHRNILANAVPI